MKCSSNLSLYRVVDWNGSLNSGIGIVARALSNKNSCNRTKLHLTLLFSIKYFQRQNLILGVILNTFCSMFPTPSTVSKLLRFSQKILCVVNHLVYLKIINKNIDLEVKKVTIISLMQTLCLVRNAIHSVQFQMRNFPQRSIEIKWKSQWCVIYQNDIPDRNWKWNSIWEKWFLDLWRGPRQTLAAQRELDNRSIIFILCQV